MCHFSISSGGRTDVRRHQESARHARLSWRREGLDEGWDDQNIGPIAHSAIFRQTCSTLNML